MSEPEVQKLMKPKFTVTEHAPTQSSQSNDDNSASHQLADSIFQTLLLLLQSHLDCSKNKRVVTAVGSLLVPYLSHWLRNKVNIYSSPKELSELVTLFRKTIWPDALEEEKLYDLDILKKLATQCVLNELPAPVVILLETEMRKLIEDVLEMTENREVNEQLCYTLIGQLLDSSLSILVD